MSNHQQIIEKMLLEGTITTPQSELIADLLAQNPTLAIAEAIEQVQSLTPTDTNSTSSNDTLFFENVEELMDNEVTSVELSDSTVSPTSTTANDTLFFENLEELVDTDVHEKSLETIQLDGLMDAVQEDVLEAHETIVPTISSLTHSHSLISAETTLRYTTADTNLIGEGGMGRVIRVFDTHLGRNIAQKELHNHFKGGKSRGGSNIQQRFIREARITAQLEHPGIVPVYEVGEKEDGTLYYTMQELTGRTLQDALKECTGLNERMKLMGHMVDFCQAIGFAHSKGIIHRDIKTENVMIDEHGQTIVLDWGLAKSIADTEDIETNSTATPLFSGKTSIGVVMGTPSYMSPEQTVGDIHKMTATTDVWSLGIVLFELITGQLPFSDNNTMMLLEKICKEDIPNASELEPKASKALCAILNKALQKSPPDRYQNAALLAQDLEAWYLGAPVSVYEYSWQDKFEKWFVNNRNAALASLLGVALLMVSIVIGTISTAQKHIEVELERDRAVEAEKSVRVSRVRSKLQAIDSKIDKLESEGSYAQAFALKRAYIDVKDKEYTRLQIKDSHGHSEAQDIHHLFRLGTKVVPSKLIPYDGGEVYAISTNQHSVVVGYSNNEIRSYSLETGELFWSHTTQGRPVEVKWITESKILVLDVERSDDINIQILSASGEPQGMLRTIPFTNKDFDYSRLFAYHQASNRLFLYTDGSVISLELDNGTRAELLQVSQSDIGAISLSQSDQYLAIAHRSSLTVFDLFAEDSTSPVTFVHPNHIPGEEFDTSIISDIAWINTDTLLFRDVVSIWKYSVPNQVGTVIYETEQKANRGSQIWNLDGTDSIVISENPRTDVHVRLNWTTLETSMFTKEQYNLPNRTQIQSLEQGQWWGYSKEEQIILQHLDSDQTLILNKFKSDIIALHHPKDGTLIAGNNTGDIQIIDYSAHIHPFYPFNLYTPDADISDSINSDSDFYRYGSLRDQWYYGTVPTHEGSTLHLFNTSTKEHRTVTFDEELYLCDVLEHSKDNQIGLSFANPCDYEGGGGKARLSGEYKFGVTHIPFPEGSIENLDVELLEFKFDLKGPLLQSKRTIIDDEKMYSDEDCLHFVDFKEDKPTPIVQCTGEKVTPYNGVAHSPDGTLMVFYNNAGHVAVWNRDTKLKESYTSLDILDQLHCESAALLEDKELMMLCSNTLYKFDLSKDELIQTIPFVTDVTHLLSTSDGSISLVTSKTRKRFWKITEQDEVEEYNLVEADTFQAISPDKRFAITNNGHVYQLDTMTPVLSMGPLQSMKFSNDSNTMIRKQYGQIQMSPLPEISLSLINQNDSQMHNLRVCYHSLDVVPVIPFPKDSKPWAAPELCGKGK